jgi:transposase
MTIRKYDQYQCRFKVDNPLDSIPENHPCFVVDAIVESLDFSEFNSKFIDTPGMPMYDRKLLLKIDLMGLIDGILSSRKVCEQLLYNDVYKFLAGGHVPNFRTLCIARHDNKEMFKKALLSIVVVGRKLGIVTLKHISTDGSYFKANASVNQLFTEDDVKILEELIQKRIDIDNSENLLYGDENYGIVEEDFYNSIQEIIKENIIDKAIEDIANGRGSEKIGKK